MAVLLLPFKFCLAQDLDKDRITTDWAAIKSGFLTELQKDRANFPKDWFEKTSQGADAPLQKLLDYVNGLKFDGSSFKCFKIQEKDSAKYSLLAGKVKAYNKIADTYISQLTTKYKVAAPVAKQDQNKGKDKDKNKDKKNAVAEPDSLAIYKHRIDSLEIVIKDLSDSLATQNKGLSHQKDSLATQNAELQNEVATNPANDDEGIFNYLIGNWKLLLFAFLSLCVAVITLAKKRSVEKNDVFGDENLANLKQSNKRLKDEKANLESEKKRLISENAKLESENERLNKCISDLKEQATEQKKQSTQAEGKKEKKLDKTQVEEKTRDTSVTKYLCRLTDNGTFGRIDDSFDEYSSYYHIKVAANANLTDPTLKIPFEFHGDEERAIQNWSSVLSPAADFEGSYKTSKKVRTETPGIIQYEPANECWRIVTKAKLKLY